MEFTSQPSLTSATYVIRALHGGGSAASIFELTILRRLLDHTNVMCVSVVLRSCQSSTFICASTLVTDRTSVRYATVPICDDAILQSTCKFMLATDSTNVTCVTEHLFCRKVVLNTCAGFMVILSDQLLLGLYDKCYVCSARSSSTLSFTVCRHGLLY